MRYLEARLVELAAAAKRATVLNKNEPNGGKLPEADEAEMEELLDHVRIMLSTSGVTAFDTAGAQAQSPASNETAVALAFSGDGYSGKCELRDGEFLVLRDSVARATEAPSLSKTSSALRSELLATGVLIKQNDGSMRFTQDFAFGSASGSAQVLCGANVNGKVSWKLSDGRTLKDWLEESLAGVTGDE